jgi:hypothetical protein
LTSGVPNVSTLFFPKVTFTQSYRSNAMWTPRSTVESVLWFPLQETFGQCSLVPLFPGFSILRSKSPLSTSLFVHQRILLTSRVRDFGYLGPWVNEIYPSHEVACTTGTSILSIPLNCRVNDGVKTR